MTAHTKLSAKGQVVIPKDVRERLRWKVGTDLEVIEQPRGIALRAKEWHNPFPRTKTEDLDKLPAYQGTPKTIEEISQLSDEDVLYMLDQQERDARDR